MCTCLTGEARAPLPGSLLDTRALGGACTREQGSLGMAGSPSADSDTRMGGRLFTLEVTVGSPVRERDVRPAGVARCCRSNSWPWSTCFCSSEVPAGAAGFSGPHAAEIEVSASGLSLRLWEEPFQACSGCWHRQVPGRAEVLLLCSCQLGAAPTSQRPLPGPCSRPLPPNAWKPLPPSLITSPLTPAGETSLLIASQ